MNWRSHFISLGLAEHPKAIFDKYTHGDHVIDHRLCDTLALSVHFVDVQ